MRKPETRTRRKCDKDRNGRETDTERERERKRERGGEVKGEGEQNRKKQACRDSLRGVRGEEGRRKVRTILLALLQLIGGEDGRASCITRGVCCIQRIRVRGKGRGPTTVLGIARRNRRTRRRSRGRQAERWHTRTHTCTHTVDACRRRLEMLEGGPRASARCLRQDIRPDAARCNGSALSVNACPNPRATRASHAPSLSRLLSRCGNFHARSRGNETRRDETHRGCETLSRDREALSIRAAVLLSPRRSLRFYFQKYLPKLARERN
jgi:hypothetical protein